MGQLLSWMRLLLPYSRQGASPATDPLSPVDIAQGAPHPATIAKRFSALTRCGSRAADLAVMHNRCGAGRSQRPSPVGTKVPVPRLHCQTDLRVGKTIMRAKDAWEPATDCAVRSQQTDDERTYTSFTKLRNSWIRARRSRIAKKRVSTLRMAALAIAKE